VLRLGVLGSGDGTEETRIELGRPAGGAVGLLRLDRSRASLDSSVDAGEKSGPVPMTEGRVRLRVLVDRSAVEIFANGRPLTARAYPTLGGGHVTLSATGSVRLLSFDAWTMADIGGGARTLFP
jgi:beta-fructofuranosidase